MLNDKQQHTKTKVGPDDPKRRKRFGVIAAISLVVGIVLLFFFSIKHKANWWVLLFFQLPIMWLVLQLMTWTERLLDKLKDRLDKDK